MKIVIRIVLIVISAIIVFYALLCVGEYFVKKNSQNNAEVTTTVSRNFTIEEFPKYGASAETKDIANAFLKEYANNKISENNPDLAENKNGYSKLIDGEIDLLFSSKPSEEDLKYAEEKNIELEMVPIAKEGLVFFVNNNNSIDGLTLKEIQNIYSKTINNWKDVSGTNIKIKALQLGEDSGAQVEISSLVMTEKELMSKEKDNIYKDTEEMIETVASQNIGENAIGFAYLHSVSGYKSENEKDGIKVLKLDDIEPNNESIKDNKYPLCTEYYVVIRKDESTNKIVKEMINEMISTNGQKIVEKAGYIAIK